MTVGQAVGQASSEFFCPQLSLQDNHVLITLFRFVS